MQKKIPRIPEVAYYLGMRKWVHHERERNSTFEIAYRQADLRSRYRVTMGELKARKGTGWAQAFIKAALDVLRWTRAPRN